MKEIDQDRILQAESSNTILKLELRVCISERQGQNKQEYIINIINNSLHTS